MEEHLTPEPITPPKDVQHWLQKLKNESWEAELLVSAIAIFGTFQLFKVAEWTTDTFIDLLPLEQYIIGYGIIIMTYLAIGILATMFVIHFFLRAYWVGLVGLNSVFPDYGLEESAYSPIYTEKILGILPTQEASIQKVDELCSVIFSAAFCLLLIYAYFSISSSILLFLYNKLSDVVPSTILLIPVVLLSVVFVLQVLISIVANLKRYKHNERIQTWYFKLVRIGSILMMGPLYKSILQITMTFGSNFKKKKAMVWMILLFFFFGTLVAMFSAFQSNMLVLMLDKPFKSDVAYESYYHDQNTENEFLVNPELESELVHSKLIKVFIPLYKNESENELQTCGVYVSNEELEEEVNKELKRAFYMKCITKYHQLFLNGKKVVVEFSRQVHPRTGQYGVVTYLRSDDIKGGKNLLLIQKMSGEKVASEWTMPFFYYPRE